MSKKVENIPAGPLIRCRDFKTEEDYLAEVIIQMEPLLRKHGFKRGHLQKTPATDAYTVFLKDKHMGSENGNSIPVRSAVILKYDSLIITLEDQFAMFIPEDRLLLAYHRINTLNARLLYSKLCLTKSEEGYQLVSRYPLNIADCYSEDSFMDALMRISVGFYLEGELLQRLGLEQLEPEEEECLADLLDRHEQKRGIRLVGEETMDFALRGSDSAVLLCYRGSEDSVMVPATVRGLPVTEIACSAFEGSRVREVQIPVTVRAIGDAAFKGCTDLRCVSIFPLSKPETEAARWMEAKDGKISRFPRLEYVGAKAFRHTSLENLDFIRSAPPRLTVGVSAFQNCLELREVRIPDCPHLEIRDYAFAVCRELELFSAPRSRTKIGQYAFGSCKNLTFLFFSGELETVDGTAFYDCPGIQLTAPPDDDRFWINANSLYGKEEKTL